MIAFAAGNLSTAKTAGALYFDTFNAEFHGTANGLFHSTTEGNSAFKLCCNVFCNKLCVFIRLFNFNNVEENLNFFFFAFVEHLLAFKAKFFNFRTLTADYHTGFCAMNVDSHFVVAGAFDFYFRNACAVKFVFEEFTKVVILYKSVAEDCVLGKPAGIPIFNYTNTETVGINFLSH